MEGLANVIAPWACMVTAFSPITQERRVLERVMWEVESRGKSSID